MSLHGPIVVIADDSNIELADAIKVAGGTPIVECVFAKAPDVIRTSFPAAVVIAAPAKHEQHDDLTAIAAAVDILQANYLPVLMRVESRGGPVIPDSLPISAGTAVDRIVAQIASAQ